MQSEITELIILVTLALALAAMWYFGWVVPNDQFLNAVMDCMNESGDHTEQGYRVCADQIAS